MSNYDEVKFLRRLLEESRREVRIMQAQRDGARDRCKSLETLVKAQQESIREANDARRVSQHFAMQHLRTALLQQDAMDQAKEELDYSLEDLPEHKRVCDHRLWWANFHAWKILHDRRAQ